jgi:hypothetical protein
MKDKYVKRLFSHKGICTFNPKKFKMCILFVFFFAIKGYSLENENSISFGLLGFGYDIENNVNTGYLFGNFFEFLHQSSTGVGLNISPLHFTIDLKDSNIAKVTFVNVTFFYNFIKSSYFILGPFASIYTISYTNIFAFDSKFGIRFAIRNYGDDSFFAFNYLFSELGYKLNNDGVAAIYGKIGIDLLWVLALLGEGHRSEFEQTQNENQMIY